MKFSTECKHAFKKDYIKVYIDNDAELENTKLLLSSLRSVKNVNITHNKQLDITVYPAKMYKIEETQKEIEECLSNYDIVNIEIVNDIENQLSIVQPNVHNLLSKAKNDYIIGTDIRHIADDMRLALELHLKYVFQNNKSLENQKEDINIYFKEHNKSDEVKDLIVSTFVRYTRYQNNNVKHNNSITREDLDFIIGLTLLILKTFKR